MSWLIIDNTTNMPVTGDPVEALPDPMEPGTRAEIVALGYPDTVSWSPYGGAYGNGGFVYPEPAPLISVGRFKLLFTQAERIALRQAAASSAEIADFLDLLPGFTEGVSLSDPVLVGALNQIMSAGLITQTRLDEILAGTNPS